DRGSGDGYDRPVAEPAAERDRMAELQHRPVAVDGYATQAAIGVDGGRMADGGQQRYIGDPVGVRVRGVEGVLASLRHLPYRGDLLLAGRVERHLAGVPAVPDHHAGRDDVGRAEQFADRPDDLVTGGGDEDDIPPGREMLLDKRGRFGVYVRVDQLVQGLIDDLA